MNEIVKLLFYLSMISSSTDEEQKYEDEGGNMWELLGYLLGFAAFYKAVIYIEEKFGGYGTAAILLGLFLVFKKQVFWLLKWGLRIGVSLLVTLPISFLVAQSIPSYYFQSDSVVMLLILGDIALGLVVYNVLVKRWFTKPNDEWEEL